jgi:CubicO group peptidase (beta-lactamase class C family)
VSPAAVNLAPEVLAEATALLEQFVADGRIAGGVAAIARRGQIGYLKAVGVQDLGTRAPMTERSLFRIYSMTKAVTAVAAMMLHDEGRFRLDDPSRNTCRSSRTCGGGRPRAAPRAPVRAVTIEDLLLHTSGLSHRTSELYRTLGVRSRADTLPAFIRKITAAPLMEDPHTRFRYSEATTVLGRLVEIWSGEPLDRFFAGRIFQPLGMTDTVFFVEGDRAARLATVYGPAPGGGLVPVDIEPVPFTTKPALLEGAVGLVSSVPDFLRFAQMLLDKGTFNGARILGRRRRRASPRTACPPTCWRRGRPHGLGPRQRQRAMTADSSGASVGEYGWDGTAGTIFWNDPVKQTVVVLMTQSSPANPDGLRQKFKAIADRAAR